MRCGKKARRVGDGCVQKPNLQQAYKQEQKHIAKTIRIVIKISELKTQNQSVSLLGIQNLGHPPLAFQQNIENTVRITTTNTKRSRIVAWLV